MGGSYIYSSRSTGYAWQGIAMMICLVILAVLQFNILGTTISLLFLPVIGICLWPRGASALVSIIALFVFGLLLDFLSEGPLGLWSMIYLALFTLFRPLERAKPMTFQTAVLQWLLMILIAMIMAFLLGWISNGQRPSIILIGYQGAIVTALFPIIYGFRSILRRFAIDPSDRNF